MTSPNHHGPQIAVQSASQENLAQDGPRLERGRNNSAILMKTQGSHHSQRQFKTSPSTHSRNREGSFQNTIFGISPTPVHHQRLSVQSRDESLPQQWPTKELENAPELAILNKKPTHYTSGRSQNSYCAKLLRCFGTVCKNKVADSCGLDNFNPVIARTDNNVEFVNMLLRAYVVNMRYGKGTASRTSLQSGSTSTNKHSELSKDEHREVGSKNAAMKELYEHAHKTLLILQQCIGHFKQMIFTLTFTKYGDEPLTEPEIKMTRGKSIIGSCIWIVVYALQQLQDDPDIEPAESQPKPHQGVHDLANEMQHLINQSFYTWHEMVIAVGALERMHKKTEELFHRQTTHFHTTSAPDSEAANVAGLHLKKYRRGDADIEELKNLRNFDPYATLLVWNNRIGLSRILYKTEYTRPDTLWWGFDTLSVDKKVAYLKDVLNFLKRIFDSVKEVAQKISNELQGRFISRRGSYMPSASARHSGGYDPLSGVANYEEGIDMMDKVLTRKLLHYDWTPEEVHEFFEVDKIFLDEMDVLTLGAGVTRAILHEARHMMHICYETSRLLDFKEFAMLPSYERVYNRLKDEFMEKTQQKKIRRMSTGTTSYDIEEGHLELRNVTGLFRTSIYNEILKNLPLYCSRVALTLQDSELVFTPSSEKLLS
ncbi:hypothetical protein Ocin01_14927 [Orchesella cincta]|uniref:Uncharacterized protein n=1 Tax=Orchesella cincta TaxID=48709 RepID=A0A1D2MFU0_ORCCI|nr:hypothetical protein Ocin01_14927 [Orchesella cincta]